MTDRLAPGPEARARIQQFSQKELQAFLDEVPAPAIRSLAPYLPPVDGFRRGSPAGIIKQKEALARRLSRPAANEHDYKALYMVWRTWIDETQPNAPVIQILIDKIEEAADEADEQESRTLAIARHTDALLEKLKEESQQNRSTREGIERLYTFSPLPETTAAREIIAAAKSAAEVERDTTFHNLPKRLDQDEHEIQTVKSELQSLANRVAAISDQLAEALLEMPKLRDAIQEARSTADAARTAVNKQAAIKSAQDRNERERAATAARIKTLTDELGALRESVGEMVSSFGRANSAEHAVKELSEKQAQFETNQQQHASQVEQLTADVDTIRADVDALLDDQTQADRIEPLAEQLAELARRVDTAATRPQSIEQTNGNSTRVPGVSSTLWCAPLPALGHAIAISSHAALITAFVNALLPIGLRKSGAQLLAEECAAAVAARQAIFLQGAFASRVARALAAATGGASSARFAMPIGLPDGGPFRLAIEEAFASLSDGVGGLAIEGFNHAPLDLIREIVADCIGPAATPPNAPYRRIGVFASLSRGVAALPIEPEVLELGPVFDLDYLDWRSNPAEATPSQASFLPAKTDQALLAQISGTSVKAEEAVHLAQALAPKRNPAVERNVVRAYQALHLLRSDQETVTPLHSLFYGWLLPYWRALGLSREQVDSEFDGGKVHGAPADGRLTAMFEADFPDSKKDGAP